MENELINVLVAIAVAVVIIVAVFGYKTFRESEFWAKYKNKFDAFQRFVELAVIQVAEAANAQDSAETMQKYMEKAEQWKTEKGVDIDYRMWAVLDKIEQHPLFAGFLEFDTALTVVEGIYQTIRKNPKNGLILNPAKDIAEAGTIDTSYAALDTETVA